MSNCCCGTGVDTAVLEQKQRRVLMSVLIINALTFFMMIAAAAASGSSALLSGAMDNLGDALTYAVSFAVVGAAATVKAKVALFKGLLILCAAFAVGLQIVWRLLNPEVPVFTTMGLAAGLNLAANGLCLWLLTPYRHQDVNMSSVWECSRNDVFEGFAVIIAAALVGWFNAGWPDLVIAIGLLALFLRSAWRVFRQAWQDLRNVPPNGQVLRRQSAVNR